MITVQKDDIYMEIDERVLSEHERLGWRVVDKLPENNAAQGVSQETHNAVLVENEHLTKRIAELESENAQLKTHLAEFEKGSSKTKKTT